jgi:hypothetical protein
LTAIWAAPFAWEFYQYEGIGGWHLGVGVGVGVAVSFVGFMLLVLLMQDDDMAPVWEGRKGWLIAWAVASLAIAGMFLAFMFGLSEADFAAMQRFGSGTAAHVIAVLSTALWSPILALAVLVPARLAIGAYRLFDPTAFASSALRKWVTLGIALSGIWLLMLLLALMPPLA